jgi:hypothetical protein
MKIREILETQAKVTKVKPGIEAEIDNGDGTRTVVDLKKNPQALTKDPVTKSIKMNTKPKTGETPDPAKIIKPGDSVKTDDK